MRRTPHQKLVHQRGLLESADRASSTALCHSNSLHVRFDLRVDGRRKDVRSWISSLKAGVGLIFSSLVMMKSWRRASWDLPARGLRGAKSVKCQVSASCPLDPSEMEIGFHEVEDSSAGVEGKAPEPRVSVRCPTSKGPGHADVFQAVRSMRLSTKSLENSFPGGIRSLLSTRRKPCLGRHHDLDDIVNGDRFSDDVLTQRLQPCNKLI